VRIEDRGCLRHKMDAAEDNNIGIGPGGFLAQLQRIPDEVRDVLHLAALVVMGEDDGVPCFLKFENSLLYCLHQIYFTLYQALFI